MAWPRARDAHAAWKAGGTGRPALVDFKPPFGVRELSKRSGASLGSTYRTVDFLDKEALISRAKGGEVVRADWPDLLLRWSEDYSFQGSNQVTAVLEPRGPGRVVESFSGAKPNMRSPAR